MMESSLIKKSKYLSKVLRHDPASVGITLTEAGWASVTKILQALNLKKEELDQIVAGNNKNRFEYSENGYHIRARQGHSVDVDLGYPEAEPPDVLYHGTSKHNLPVIEVQGLKKMQRHHVHMSPDVATAEMVAKRRPAPRVLVVDSKSMAGAGVKFYLTGNGVWLTDYVDPKYIKEYHP
jgi:putative RNA 2'-phosphotransferase